MTAAVLISATGAKSFAMLNGSLGLISSLMMLADDSMNSV